MKLLPVVALLLAPAFTVSIKERLEAQTSVGQYEYVIFYLLILAITLILTQTHMLIHMQTHLMAIQLCMKLDM